MGQTPLVSTVYSTKKPLAAIRQVAFLVFALGFFSLFGQKVDDVFPPKPSEYVAVHDYASWLTPDEKLRLETRLQQYEDRTSTQIVVMIRPDLGDYDKSAYATELGLRWDVGQKGKNNGLVMLIKTEMPYRGAFIASGYGVEGALPDGLLGEIVRVRMIPFFKNGQNFEGIVSGLDAIEKAIAGEFKAEPKPKASGWELVIVLLIFLLIVCVFAWISYKTRKNMGETYSGRGVARRRTIERDGGGWWWGTGGGNWGGGGSHSGGWGGGSSGGGWSSGDFGGGDFGGGGAGGDWLFLKKAKKSLGSFSGRGFFAF